MRFEQLDSRPQGAEKNDSILANEERVMGIEVTIPALAARCGLGNLDHHGPDSTAETPSAAEQALEMYREGKMLGWEVSLVTVRPDADSVTAMAILLWRNEHSSDIPLRRDIIGEVGRIDRLGPAAGKPSAAAKAIARVACNSRLSLGERVEFVADIIVGNKLDEVNRIATEVDAELSAAREASEVSLVADGKIATVVSTHRFAFDLGYEAASVVVALNPELPVQGTDDKVKKFTIARRDNHVLCDIEGATSELNEIEPGWGGRGDIAGSPQGVSSKLTLGQVLEVVTRHLS